jgi:Uma2 family endonuclease
VATSTRTEVRYPESDGQPMGETTFHRDATIELILALQDWFAADPMAYVSGDDFLYWIEGQPRWTVSPDVWCVRGIDKTILRRVYKTWEEGGRGPELVVEMTSRSTRREDRGKKFRIYRDDLKVREYFLFDPLGEYLAPPLQGHRLVGAEYHPIEPRAGRLPSEVLGLYLEAVGPLIRLHDPATDRRLLTRLERIEQEKGARRQVDAKLRRTNAQIRQKDATIQAQEATIRAQEAANQALEAATQAQAAAIRAQEAAFRQSQAEVDRLGQELDALRAGRKPKPKRK